MSIDYKFLSGLLKHNLKLHISSPSFNMEVLVLTILNRI